MTSAPGDPRDREPLDLAAVLDRAEIEFLLHPEEPGKKFASIFPVRRRRGMTDFYERLEHQLRLNPGFDVLEYRTVREGYAKVSRPAVLQLTREELLRRRPHLEILRRQVQDWRQRYTFLNLEEFLRRHRNEALVDPERTAHCLDVLGYLITHQEAVIGLLRRQIPHGRSSKLIGREPLLLRLFSFWRGQPATWSAFFDHFQILDRPPEFRFYAPSCRCQGAPLHRFHGILAPDWRSDFDFAELKATLIVENLETFSSLVRPCRDTLLVWGGGWRAAQLKGMIRTLPTPVFYWGDIDKEGYEILGFLQNFAPDIRPVCMDQATIDRYSYLQQAKEKFNGPFRTVIGLQTEYENVCRLGLQIEQEQLTEGWPLGI